MQTFFLQLFLSFWLATLAILIGATVLFPNGIHHTPDELEALVGTTGQQSLELLLQDYRRGGCSGTVLRDSSWFVVDARGFPLCGQTLTPAERSVLESAKVQGALIGRRSGGQWIDALPVISATGQRWFLIVRTPATRFSFFPSFPRTALPVSLLVTFFFAYLLTRPLRALSHAFRDFTAGKLDTRLPVAVPTRWCRFDSADVRTLMADFNAMADRVSELIDAQRMLIRDVSHELRSPLARLRLALELARESSTVDQALFDQAEHETEKVNALIGEMLTLSLLESAGGQVKLEPLDITALVMEIVDEARFEANARDCTILVNSRLDGQIMGQADTLRRAIENILRNAIRYTPAEEQIEVEIADAAADEAAAAQVRIPAVTISVRDQGPGIPLDHLSQVFRPFYRVDMARSESSGGFGVGLAIAERAVHVHGGKIIAKNRPSRGLDVTILLPRTPTEVHIRTGTALQGKGAPGRWQGL